jgi:mycothiol system anti-sigma-R factor
MECRDVVSRLWEYLDEELGPEEASAVEGHLGRCEHCHSGYCCDRAFLELLARLRASCTAPTILVASIRARLRLY